MVDPAVPDCPDVITVVVEEDGGLEVTAEIIEYPECGENNGTVSINVANGSGNYTYSWGGQTVTNLGAGTYEVSVVDNVTGCTGSVTFILLNDDPQATVTINGQPSLGCSGDNDGFVDFTVNYSGNFAFPADTIIQDAQGNIYTNGNLPAVGEQAPEFVLVDGELNNRKLSDFSGKKIIMNIVPSLDTPVCATSTKKFNEYADAHKDTTILIISADLPFAFARFCTTEGIENVVSLSVFKSPAFGKDYGVGIEEGVLAGLLSRAVVVVDEAGNVAYTEQVPEIAQEPDYAAALSAMK